MSNGKQTKPKVSAEQVKSLAGRVQKLNKLARQHATNGPKPSERIVAEGASPSDRGTPRGGSVSSGSISTAALPPVKKPRKRSPRKGPVASFVTVRSSNGEMHKMPLAPDAGGSESGTKKHRVYHDKGGHPVATTELVHDASAFKNRLSTVKHPNFASKAVGIAESQLYHGSKSMEMDFVRAGVRGTRVAGNQYLDIVQTGGGSYAAGDRLTFALVNPASLGSVLKKMAQVYEQVKFVHFKVIYKPIVPTTTAGAVAIYFRNDTSNPIYETGLDELNAASSHQSFVETTVWSPASIDVSPSDMILKYWDEMNGDYADEVQGMITCIATSALASNFDFGHLYIEYDVEFSSPELDYEVDEVGIARLTATFTSYTSVSGSAIRLVFTAAGAGLSTAQWLSGAPPNGEFLCYGVIENVTGAAPVAWNTTTDTETHNFMVGQGFYIRFAGNSNNFTNATMVAYLYADLESASDNVSDDDPSNGQLTYFSSTVGYANVATLRLRLIALAEGQE